MNPNAIPDYSAFASSLTPDQRSYVQNYVLSAIAELVSPLIEQSMALTKQNRALQSNIEAINLRIENYESKFRDDMKYTLNRAKIVTLMKELGIE